jgi:hypothetical protein
VIEPKEKKRTSEQTKYDCGRSNELTTTKQNSRKNKKL